MNVHLIVWFQSQFQKHGGVIRDEETMLDLVPGSTVTVKTNKGEYRAKAVVIVPGPWAPVVLPKLGINVPLEVRCKQLERERDRQTYRQRQTDRRDDTLLTCAHFPSLPHSHTQINTHTYRHN